MTLKNGDRFTVYDAMEASGMFSTNPANVNSRDKDGRVLYKGPVKFPMLLYHPRGEEKILVHGVTSPAYPGGPPEKFGEQWEIVSREVTSQGELDEALAEGWHRHPAHAIKVANETWRKEMGLKPLPVPPISAASRISDLEEENRRLTEMLTQAKKDAGVEDDGGGFVPPDPNNSPTKQAGLV